MNESQKSSQNDAGISIDLWAIARLILSKFYWLVFAGIGFGVTVLLILHFFVSPTYKSDVSFYVYNTSDNAVSHGRINSGDLQAAASLAATYSKILESNSVLDAVLKDLGSSNYLARDLSRSSLREITDISVDRLSPLIKVVVTSNNAQFACTVADSFARVVPTEIVRITKAGGVEVVDRPEVALSKSSPKTVSDTLIGVIVGVVFAAVIVIIRALSDTTLYLPEDIEKLGGSAVVLGQIPEIELQEDYKYWKVIKGGMVRFAEKDNKENNDGTADFA